MAKEKQRDPIALEMGRRLKADREARGWTQRDLAMRTNWSPNKDDGEQKSVISPSRIGNYEQGTRRMGHEEAQIFSRLFDRPSAYYLAVISDQEASVLSAMRQTAA